MEIRPDDKWGSGVFGAGRDGGKRTHRGVDVVNRVGYPVFSPVDGKVTKIGYPYSDKPEFRYVQITSGVYDYRLFYVNPIVQVGQEVKQGLTIGLAQDLNKPYPGITQHLHFEIKNKAGGYIDPTPVIIALESANMPIV